MLLRKNIILFCQGKTTFYLTFYSSLHGHKLKTFKTVVELVGKKVTATENKYHNVYILERESTKKAFWGALAKMLNRKELQTQMIITLRRSTTGVFFIIIALPIYEIFLINGPTVAKTQSLRAVLLFHNTGDTTATN